MFKIYNTMQCNAKYTCMISDLINIGLFICAVEQMGGGGSGYVKMDI